VSQTGESSIFDYDRTGRLVQGDTWCEKLRLGGVRPII